PMGTVSRAREPDYAVALCEAYNNYVYDHYVKVSDRLKPIAIISPQDPERAAIELRRAVKQLGYRAAVVRTTGLRVPLGHRFYDPIYREAESLNCAIAVHGTNGGDELASGAFETFTEVHMVSFPVGIFVQFSNNDFSGRPRAISKIAFGLSRNRLHLAALLAGPHGRAVGEARQNRNAALDSASQRLRAATADFFQLGVRRGSSRGNFPLRRGRPFPIRHRHSALGQRVPGKSTEDTKTAGSHREDQEQDTLRKRESPVRHLSRLGHLPRSR